ncbi:MAG TPA: hypothetical protein VFL85_04785 [Candidatus Saccharimonadales bacterium]|nr:hypothetical protein [Candidatus Saccharimonadales bacterium]
MSNSENFEVYREQEPAQAITIQSPREKRTWRQAAWEFRHDPQVGLVLRLLPAGLLTYLPVNVADDFIPVIGEVDDAGWVALAAYVVYRISKYR